LKLIDSHENYQGALQWYPNDGQCWDSAWENIVVDITINIKKLTREA